MDRDGLPLDYTTLGNPETPGVVLLHDTGEDARSWHPLALALSRDFFVVLPDLRGHGHSGCPDSATDYSIDAFTADLGALLDHLGLELAAVGGAGFGALVALHFACQNPTRIAGLVLCDATPAPAHAAYDDDLREYEDALRSFAEDACLRGMHRLARDAAAGIDDPFLAGGVRQVYLRVSPEALAGAASTRANRPDLVPVLGEQLGSVPVMLCYGALGPFGSAAAIMARELPQARVAVFRDVVLAPHLAAPDAFAEQLYAFFDALERGQGIAGSFTV